jgi:uncharacterized membrane protein
MSEVSENKEDNKLNNLYWLLAAVTAIWLVSIFIIPFFYSELTKRGSFGDSFGVINSLFSGLAFAGIIYTILLQRKELKLQREELELTRKELAKSAEAQIASQRELVKQSLNMKRTAELNALSTLIQDIHNQQDYYRSQKQSYHELLNELDSEKKGYKDRIKDILADKQL